MPAFVLAAALQGVYRALDSGPMEAWYVDAAHAEDATIPVDQALSRAGTVIGLAIALGALTSGGLVAWHPIGSQSPLLLPFWIAIGLNLVHLVGCAVLVREPRPARRFTSPGRVVLGARGAAGDRWTAYDCWAPRGYCAAWSWSSCSGASP